MNDVLIHLYKLNNVPFYEVLPAFNSLCQTGDKNNISFIAFWQFELTTNVKSQQSSRLLPSVLFYNTRGQQILLYKIKTEGL